MKRKARISIVFVLLGMLLSCDYDTHVLNVVHKDGSVTRRITVENRSDYWEPKRFRVPIDSTWKTEVNYQIRENKDTVWFLTAEKHFQSVHEINEGYRRDLGSNRAMERSVAFSKKFRWFTTDFRYSENVESALTVDCPLSDFLSEEELAYILLPGKVQDSLNNGPDSTRFRHLNDDLEPKIATWFCTAEIRQWTDIFQDLFGKDPSLQINRAAMVAKEPLFVAYLMEHDSVFESLFEESIIPDSLFITVLGEAFYQSFVEKASYALKLLQEMSKPVWYSDTYELEIRMPGKITATNGYAETEPGDDSATGILFTISFEQFLTQKRECWVESKVNNYLIWAITGLFVLVVITGLTRRIIL
jgi:hypothetical protein